MDYTHQFNKLDLNIAGNFGLSNFNFLPGSVNSKQKFTSGDFHAGIHFIDETAPLRFNAETNLLMYERQHNMISEMMQIQPSRKQSYAPKVMSQEPSTINNPLLSHWK